MRMEIELDESTIPWPVGLDFVGQYAGTNFYVFHIISRVLTDYPDVKSIIELGTFAGSLTLYLGMWGLRLGIPVHTFDIEPGNSKEVHHVFEAMGIQTHWGDAYTEDGIREVLECAGGEPTYLICDGGDKTREYNIFTPLVEVGSIISVHDWGSEITKLDSGILQMHYWPEEWPKYNAQFATVIKLGDAERALANMDDETTDEIRDKWIKLMGEYAEA